MCSYCRDKRTTATPNAMSPAEYNGVSPDYVEPDANIHVGRAIEADELKEMSDEDISGLAFEDAEKVAEALKARRDEINNAEFRQESVEMISEAFRFHPATTKAQADNHEQVREACKMLAYRLLDRCPPSSELDTALDRLREVMFWANAAVALG